MPGQIVEASEALARGLRTEFINTYAPKAKRVSERLSRLMEMNIPSDKSAELYHYYNSVPHPGIWVRGQDIPRKGFGGVQFEVVNYDWGHAIDWHENDEQDDQTHNLQRHARNLGGNFALLPDRIFFQFITGTTDAQLVPAIPNAPDGAALFATTAGGSNRFGVSSGNLLTGTGVATAAAIRTDFYTTIEQFRLFQDVEGQPLWDEDVLDGVYVVIFGAANLQVFAEAFIQAITQGTSAGISNVILDAGHKIVLWGTQRITDNDWFVGLADAPQKALFRQVRSPLRDNVEDFANSDRTRRTKLKALQFDERTGYGIATPYQLIKVNN